MNRHILAVFLWAFTACTLGGMIPPALIAARNRDRLMAALAVAVGLLAAAVLANAGADLW